MDNSRLTENDCGEYFLKPLFIEDTIFSVAESIQKKNMVAARFMLHKYGFILAGIKWMGAFKFNDMILDHIADILTFEFHADIS